MRRSIRTASTWFAVFAVVLAAAPASDDRRGLQARQPGPFSVEQILSAPFPSELVASPSGARVAWVFDDRGVRNVWVAEGPAFAGRRLTTYQHDDGQEITGLSFSPDGSALVFVRGGAANRAGEVPNPASNAAGAEQAVWTVPVGGGDPRKLGAGSGAAVSPKGDLVAFVQRGQIWLAGLSGTPAAAAAVHARGSARGLEWSPDGSRLAFVSGRGTHAFIGVVDIASKVITWLEPSLDTDDAPVWSPDGTRVAFIRKRSSIRSATGRRGRFASRTPSPVPAAKYGARRRGGAACSSRWSSDRNWRGPSTSAWCSRGNGTAGSICTRWRPAAATPCCSRRAPSRSMT
jgi:dipeptidyl aminopeptidase/acylaminoacyl peptidase